LGLQHRLLPSWPECLSDQRLGRRDLRHANLKQYRHRAIGNKTGSNCPGDYNQGSILVEYTLSKDLDVYGGVSYSEAIGGVASGYINDNTALFLTGVRLKF
jgi:hypothetical protein